MLAAQCTYTTGIYRPTQTITFPQSTHHIPALTSERRLKREERIINTSIVKETIEGYQEDHPT